MTTLRPWQSAAVADCLSIPPGQGRLYVAPTGTGKGTAMLAAMAALRAAGRTTLITTPSGEIARGLLDRLGLLDPGAEVGEAALWRVAESAGIYSPVRLRNRLASGVVEAPEVLLVDEGHHATAASVAVMAALASQIPTWIGWTATPYRGSHRETLALRAWWGEPRVLLTIAEAVRDRYLSAPTPEVWPLLDDRHVAIRSGEYDEASATKAAVEQGTTEHLIARLGVARWVDEGGRWIRPTLLAVPGGEYRDALAEALSEAGFPSAPISGDTPRAERDALLARCRAREVALVQVQVLSEGVDMPWLRRLVDLRPTRSPVAWMQRLGRITRPIDEGEPAPEYICGCRNLERHGYLWAGTWPSRKIAVAAQMAFRPSSEEPECFEEVEDRDGPLDRGLAADALGRKRRYRVPLLGGGFACVLTLARAVGFGVERQVMALGVPGEEAPRVFARDVQMAGEERSTWTWGRWSAAPGIDPDGYAGFARPPSQDRGLSEKQLAWWRRDAGRYGLDPEARITRHEFAVLPALADSRTTLLPEREMIATTNVRGGLVASEQAPATPDCVPGGAGAAFPIARENGISSSQGAGGSESPAPSLVPAPRTHPATWAKLHSGGWGARVVFGQGDPPRPGDVLELQTKPDAAGNTRRTRKMFAREVARGMGYCLCELET